MEDDGPQKTQSNANHRQRLISPTLEDSLLVDLILWKPLLSVPGLRRCIPALLAFLHRIRWWLAFPLQAKVLGAAPCRRLRVRALERLSWGELLLMLPLGSMVPVMFVTGFMDVPLSSHRGMGMSLSGAWATLAMWGAFWTANKANSFFTLICGQTFEHLISVHLVVSVAALLMAVMHGVLCYQGWNDTIHPISPHYGNSHTDPDDPRFHNRSEVLYFYNQTAASLVLDNPSRNETVSLWSYQNAIGTSYSRDSDRPNWLFFAFDGKWNWSGTYCTLAFAVLVFSSVFGFIRRKFYTLWYWSHILACVALLVFGYVHFRVSLFLFVTWGVDVILRYVILSCCRYPHTADIKTIIEGQVVCVSWPATRAFHYNPGQFVRIAFPGLLKGKASKEGLMYHPISIGSSPFEDTVRLYIRGLGPWSQQLVDMAADASPCCPKQSSKQFQSLPFESEEDAALSETSISSDDDDEETANMSNMASSATSSSRSKQLRIFLEGPYGSMAIPLESSKIVLFASGGVGVAPCQSIALSLLMRHQQQQQQSPLFKMYFCWSIRELELKDKMLAHDLYDHPDVHKELEELEGYNKRNSITSKDDVSDNDNSIDDDHRHSRLVETDIYHTRGPKLLQAKQENFTTTLHSGCRPDLDALFRRVLGKAYQISARRVAVVTCGPTKLTEQVRQACNQYSSRSLHQVLGGRCYKYQSIGGEGGGYCSFDLHEEEFEF